MRYGRLLAGPPVLVAEAVPEGEERGVRVVRDVGVLTAHRGHRGRQLERELRRRRVAAEDDVEERAVPGAEVAEERGAPLGELGKDCRPVEEDVHDRRDAL